MHSKQSTVNLSNSPALAYGHPATDVYTPVRVSDFLDRLTESLSSLSVTVEQLAQCLSPVILHSNDCTELKTKPEPVLCDISKRLVDEIGRIHELDYQVRYIIEHNQL